MLYYLIAQVQAVVTVMPKIFPVEVPGVCKLMQTLHTEGRPDVVEVELWSRCLPDFLFCKLGDILVLDVVYYKREKLVFARNVSMLTYEPLNRVFLTTYTLSLSLELNCILQETGRIVRIREGDSFGFIRSTLREVDVYFRIKEVTRTTTSGGRCELVPPEYVTSSTPVSFNLVLDELTGNKFKAARVHMVEDSTSVEVGARRILLHSGVHGIIIREASKEQSGQVKITSDIECIEEIMYRHVYEDIIEGLQKFNSNNFLTEMIIENLITSQRKAYYEILDTIFTGIAYELQEINAAQASVGGIRTIKIFKLTTDEFIEWKNGLKTNQEHLREADREELVDVVNYLKADTNDSNGQLRAQFSVVFDLYFDRKSGRRVARNMTVHEVVPDGLGGQQLGVVQVIKSKNNARYGIIRVFPTHEKLFWHSSCVLSRAEDLREGMEVSYLIRVRGGTRCAVDITPTASSFLSVDLVAEGRVQVVVVEGGRGVIVDTGDCDAIAGVYVDLVTSLASLSGASTASWSKQTLKERPCGDAEVLNKPAALEAGETMEDPAALHFFIPCERTAIPLDQGADLKLGSIVWCKPVLRWAASISPVRLTQAEVPVGIAGRYRGIVKRVKLKNSEGVSFCEVEKDSVVTAAGGLDDVKAIDAPMFCFVEEKRKQLHVGELVEFMALPGLPIAVNANPHRILHPPVPDKNGAVYRIYDNTDPL
jgi:cold shock CspA family protein